MLCYSENAATGQYSAADPPHSPYPHSKMTRSVQVSPSRFNFCCIIDARLRIGNMLISHGDVLILHWGELRPQVLDRLLRFRGHFCLSLLR